MDCNKEEAIRAKGIAEKMMESKDFAGALKIVFKAQKIYPDLENVSQMIMVCDVHCAAENKLYGNEKDWYGILKIEPTADEASIKKQYRKFALLLHPDKNKFAGATDAFKLIGEAQKVLLDREKRMLHDSKRKAAGRSTAPNRAPKQASRNSNVGAQPWVQSNFMSSVTSQFLNKQRQPAQSQPAQSGLYNNRPTFWTVCPFCSAKYQFNTDMLNQRLWCQGCKKFFAGYDMGAQGATPGTSRNQNQGPSNIVPPNSFRKTGSTSDVGEGSKPNEKFVNVDIKTKKGRSEKPKSYGMSNGKKRKRKGSESSESCTSGSSTDSEGSEEKQVAESSESCTSGSSTNSEADIVIEEDGAHPSVQNIGSYGERYPRRSTRAKQNVSYNEDISDDDGVMNPSKRAKSSGSLHDTDQAVEDPSTEEESLNTQDMEEDEKEVKQKERSSYEESLQNEVKETEKTNENGTATEDGEKSSEDTVVPEPAIYEYPDPDFSDFDKDRKEDSFAVGQIWAVYDNLDAMPRLHARIRKVLSPGFKLRITWLEPDPDDEDEMKWVEEGLPVSCGEFRHGRSENTEDHPMFSHLVYWEKGSGRDTYKIYPRKGETWALFKNWDIRWHSDPDRKEEYEFEFVEVLSDYADCEGVRVSYLGKVRGFVCLFCRTMEEGTDSVLIPPKEIFRFSHRIPSFQMTGEERKDVPKGCFELDPACLPTNLEGIAVPESVKM